ncbi:MAG: DegT/DnrJ/EryC1/StrS family aminotransferase [Brevinematia bacterium]
MKVPFLDLTREYSFIKGEVLKQLSEIFETQSFILGKHVKSLEENLSKFLGVRDVIGVSSGTDALLISLMALDIKSGDEVIVPSFTFYATASSVARLGAKPVFADIDLETYNISVDDIDKKINKNTKCIIPVHLYGNPADINRILEIANLKNIPVVEDNAQAIGAEVDGKKTGSFGVMGCLSFYPTKNLGGAGDGGAISTNDDIISKKVRMLRVHGSGVRYYHDYIGVNGRLDEVQAAYVNIRFSRINQNNNERIRIANKYNYLLSDLEEKGFLVTPKVSNGKKHVFHQYTIRVPKYRDKLKEFLAQEGVGSDIYYPLPLHLQKCFSYLGYKEGDLPNTEKAAREVLSLPIFPGLSYKEIEYVVDMVYKFFKSI